MKLEICTLALIEYRTNWSKVVTLRWRIVRWSVWKPATMLESCPGLCRERIRIFAWVSINVTSISAIVDVLSDANWLELWDHIYWGYSKNCAKGDPKNGGVGTVWLFASSLPCCWSSFCASRDWRRCSSSFTNSIAPPTIDAWSPCIRDFLN